MSMIRDVKITNLLKFIWIVENPKTDIKLFERIYYEYTPVIPGPPPNCHLARSCILPSRNELHKCCPAMYFGRLDLSSQFCINRCKKSINSKLRHSNYDKLFKNYTYFIPDLTITFKIKLHHCICGGVSFWIELRVGKR